MAGDSVLASGSPSSNGEESWRMRSEVDQYLNQYESTRRSQQVSPPVQPEKDSGTGASSSLIDAAKDGVRAAAYHGVQAPITALAQVADYVVGGHRFEKYNQYIDAPKQAEFGSASWHAQTVGSAIGTIVPFLLTHKAVGSVCNNVALKSGLMSVSFLERSQGGLALLRTAGSAATGFVYEGLLQPVKAVDDNFLSSKFKNGVTGAIQFGAMTGLASGLRAFDQALLLERPWLVDTFRRDFGRHVLSGVASGVIGANAHSLLNEHRFATGTEALQTAYSMALIGGLFTAGQEGIGRYKGGQRLSDHVDRLPALQDQAVKHKGFGDFLSEHGGEVRLKEFDGGTRMLAKEIIHADNKYAVILLDGKQYACRLSDSGYWMQGPKFEGREGDCKVEVYTESAKDLKLALQVLMPEMEGRGEIGENCVQWKSANPFRSEPIGTPGEEAKGVILYAEDRPSAEILQRAVDEALVKAGLRFDKAQENGNVGKLRTGDDTSNRVTLVRDHWDIIRTADGNFARLEDRVSRRFLEKVGLPWDATPEQIEKALRATEAQLLLPVDELSWHEGSLLFRSEFENRVRKTSMYVAEGTGDAKSLATGRRALYRLYHALGIDPVTMADLPNAGEPITDLRDPAGRSRFRIPIPSDKPEAVKPDLKPVEHTKSIMFAENSEPLRFLYNTTAAAERAMQDIVVIEPDPALLAMHPFYPGNSSVIEQLSTLMKQSDQKVKAVVSRPPLKIMPRRRK